LTPSAVVHTNEHVTPYDSDRGSWQAAPSGRQGRILLVEDDFAVRRTLAEVLIDEGYDVDCAANGAEAVLTLGSSPVKPRVIILDLWMPYMDGLEFRALQRSLPWMADIPVIVITAGGVPLADAEGLGLTCTLRKPLNLEDLLSNIEKLALPASS
jgi:CheY-like chemotaxis protein